MQRIKFEFFNGRLPWQPKTDALRHNKHYWKSTTTLMIEMDVFSDYTSPVVEFRPTQPIDKVKVTLVDNCTGTDPPPAVRNVCLATYPKVDATTQTELNAGSQTAVYDERELAKWLRRIYPMVEAELLEGPTPMLDNSMAHGELSLLEAIQVQIYQKLSMHSSIENSQGLATWLSVYTNNAPLLVATTVAPHDDWCEHVNQSLKLYVPKRMSNGNFVVFTEVKSVQLKSCLRCLCTNPYNKNIFAGASMDGDIYLWQYEHAGNESNIEIKQLFCVSSSQSAAVAMDWPDEQRLLTCYANGLVQQWLLGKQMVMEWHYTLRPNGIGTVELTCLVSLNLNDFVVGTKSGAIYRCWHAGIVSSNSGKKQLQVTALRAHRFMVSTLLRACMAGQIVVLSCDLSGQVYYHDVRHTDEDVTNVIIQIPLPFKNAIGCTREGNIIYCPSNDGALECYRISDGAHAVIKGALHGKGNLIKCSDNGCWIVTGLYNDEFQIFYIDN